jgi:hypothetical protein
MSQLVILQPHLASNPYKPSKKVLGVFNIVSSIQIRHVSKFVKPQTRQPQTRTASNSQFKKRMRPSLRAQRLRVALKQSAQRGALGLGVCYKRYALA